MLIGLQHFEVEKDRSECSDRTHNILIYNIKTHPKETPEPEHGTLLHSMAPLECLLGTTCSNYSICPEGG